MRPQLIAIALALLASSGAGAKAAPVEPSRIAGLIDLYAPGEVDFTLVVATKEGGPVRNVTKTIRRHGAWVRIDKVDGVRTSTQYAHLPSGTVIERGANPEGPVRYLTFRAPDLDRKTADYRSIKTGKSLIVGGDTCEEWDVYRGLWEGKPTYRRFGCITPDGIELSSWTLNENGRELRFPTTATSISRAPVSPTDVEPPRELFDLRPWLAKLGKRADRRRDFEVVLVSDDTRETRIVRGRGDGRYVETRRADGKRGFFSYDAGASLQATANFSARGAPADLMLRELPLSEAPPHPRINKPSEMILGLRCDWYDVRPNVDDAGQLECRTSDGMPLKIIESSWGSSWEFVAVRIDRKRLRPGAMLPPAKLLDLEHWTQR